MKTILVPCDFSKAAEEAFKFAVKIASQSQGEIHVLYVIDITFLHGNPTLSHAYAFNTNFINEFEKEADQKFQIMSGRHAPMTMKVKFTRTISSVSLEIENYVKAHNIDLVVMGTNGAGEADFGSNTEKIVRNVDVPVLAVRNAPKEIKNIVLPVLPGQFDVTFIEQVKRLQQFFHSQLHLLYVNTPLFFKSDPESIMELTQFASEKQFSNYSIHVRSDYSVESGITRFAKEVKADMIAIGTHAWKGLAHLLIGSIAEDLVNHVQLPVWTLRLQEQSTR